jgi:A/G-specific adenine glycosylase
LPHPDGAAQRDADALVAWYRANRRDLPWRRTRDPYAILLSELMLQQTRVDTVVPYYGRFLAEWPTVGALAAAPEEDVLRAWAGLGYYRRARNLHAAARAVVAAGGFPRTVDGLLSLPGVGPYTAAAVASIAFDLPAAAVDGNVQRVISRRHGLTADPARGDGLRVDTRRALDLHEAAADASSVTQGLMELGATVCVPRAPRCDACPWGAVCVAHRDGTTAELPRLAPKVPPTAVSAVVGLLAGPDGVLVARRSGSGLLGGLWEPILGEREQGEAPEPALVRVFAERVGVDVVVGERVGEVRHRFTHRAWTGSVHRAHAIGDVIPHPGPGYDAVRFAHPGARDLAWSTLARKLLGYASIVAAPLAADGP